MLHSLAIFLQILNLLLWITHLIGLVYGKYKFGEKRNTKEANKPRRLPGVSILKPLKGVDDNLFENLSSLMSIDYPTYEVLFCVQDSDDPAVGFVERLLKKYPSVDARLFHGFDKNESTNPKLSNLCQAYDKTKYDLIMISDDCVKINPQVLSNMVALMGKRVGIVNQICYSMTSNLLQKLYFGGAYHRNYLISSLMGINALNGMSYLIRKGLIDQCGGFKYFGIFIPEYPMIEKDVLKRNYKVVLSNEPVWENPSDSSVSSWKARMTRWAQLRLHIHPIYWLEPFAECFLQGLYASWSLYYLYSMRLALVYFFAHVSIWFINDYAQIQVLEKGKFKHGLLECLPVWIYRESICYLLFWRALFNPYINWKSGIYKIEYGGIAHRTG